MSKFYDFIQCQVGLHPCGMSNKYCQIGHTFCLKTPEIEGIYWFYETDQFIINIDDFFIKKEQVNTSFPDMSPFLSFCSTYIITGNGESFNPYQTLSANSLYVIDTKSTKDYNFLLHANFPFLSVGINFKQPMIDEYLSSSKIELNLSDMFYDTRTTITASLEKIAKSILTCKMTSPAAEIFFEAKAKEWLSITIDAFVNKVNKQLPVDDEKALENVANYLNDHYAIDVCQETLEKIAMMSGTKLKKLFKQKYLVNISEYTQRRRMNIAEVLLLNSSLDIKSIAEAVGYSSHSKFSTCFKKYKGVYPREVRKAKPNIDESCSCELRNISLLYDDKTSH